MKNIKLAILIVLITCGKITAQEDVKVDYLWSKLKCEFPPLSPLPAGKTFNIELPDGLVYLESRDEVRPFWSPYGLTLINEWDTKNPASYTFKMEIEGLKLVSSEITQKASKVNITGREYMREYTFTFPSKLLVLDNSTHEVIKTIPIVTAEETFKRVLHKNLFVSSPLDPNYHNIIGFDSLAQVTRIPETDAKVLKKIEGEFATEVFEKMKTALVHLYGKAELRADFAVLNPKKKKRDFDFADYDAASASLVTAFKAVNANISEKSAYTTALGDAKKFYSTTAQSNTTRFVDFVPAMVFWNLTEICLTENDLKSAEENFSKFKTAAWPKNSYFGLMLEPAYFKTVEFLKVRGELSKY